MEAIGAIGEGKVVPCGEVVECLKKQKRKETQNDAQTCLFDVEDGCARSSSFVLLPPHSITVRKKWEVFTTAVVVVASYSGALPCPHNVYQCMLAQHAGDSQVGRRPEKNNHAKFKHTSKKQKHKHEQT